MSVDPLAEKTPYLGSYCYAGNSPLCAIDPDGRAFNFLAGAVGAAVGGVVGGAVNILHQIQSGNAINYTSVGASVAGGAVAGGLAGLTMGASLTVSTGVLGASSVLAEGALVGSVTNAVGGGVERAVNGEKIFKGEKIVSDLSNGAFGGVAGATVGTIAKAGAIEIAKSTYKEVAKAAGIKITNPGSRGGAMSLAIRKNALSIIATENTAAEIAQEVVSDKDEQKKRN